MNIDKLTEIVYSLCRTVLQTLNRLTARFSEKQKIGIITGIVFITIFLFNHLTPLTGDDYVYAFKWGQITERPVGSFICEEGFKERVHSFRDVIESQYSHYFTWGGRSFTLGFAQLFIWLEKPVFNTVNTLFFIGLIFLIYFHINGFKKVNARLYLLVTCCVWFLIPSFSFTSIWLTGSCVYLWGLVFILSFLLPYRLYAEKLFKDNWSYLFLIIPVAILAGWSNENTSAGMLAASALFVILFKQQKLPIPRWAVSGLIAALFGFIMLVAAPGNYIRSALFHNDRNVIIVFLSRLQAIVGNLLLSKVFFTILIASFAFMVYKQLGNKGHLVKYLTFIYSFAAFIAAFIMVSTQVIPIRTLYGFSAFIFIVSGIYWIHIEKRLKINYLSIVLLLILVASMGITLNKKYGIHEEYETRFALIGEQQGKKISNIHVPAIRPPEELSEYVICSYDISPDSTFWVNQAWSRYYKIHSITAIPQD